MGKLALAKMFTEIDRSLAVLQLFSSQSCSTVKAIIQTMSNVHNVNFGKHAHFHPLRFISRANKLSLPRLRCWPLGSSCPLRCYAGWPEWPESLNIDQTLAQISASAAPTDPLAFPHIF